MLFAETGLKGAYVIDTEKREDDRGFFGRIWCAKEYEEQGLVSEIVQSNVGFSPRKGTMRGLHFQLPPHDEVKIVRCTRGAIYDVIIDLRRDSPTFRKWIGVELNEGNHKMLYVPQGFAQGYITLSKDTEMYYQTTKYYAPSHARGVRYNDPVFRIYLPIPVELISESDRNWPDFEY